MAPPAPPVELSSPAETLTDRQKYAINNTHRSASTVEEVDGTKVRVWAQSVSLVLLLLRALSCTRHALLTLLPTSLR